MRVTLVLVALAAGLIAGISPCILPVLPFVFVAGVAAPDADGPARAAWRRSAAFVLGLVVSFSLLVFAGSELISLLHQPTGFLRALGIGPLIAIGLRFIFPTIATIIERPFARLVGFQPNRARGRFAIDSPSVSSSRRASGPSTSPSGWPVRVTFPEQSRTNVASPHGG